VTTGSLLTGSQKAGSNLSLGELTCRVIKRWDELDDSVKAEIAEMLRLPRSLYGSRPLLL